MRIYLWFACYVVAVGYVLTSLTPQAQAEAPDNARSEAVDVAGSRDNKRTNVWRVEANEWYPASKSGALYISQGEGKNKVSKALVYVNHPDFEYLTRLQPKNLVLFHFKDDGQVPQFPMTFLRINKVICGADHPVLELPFD